LGENKKALGVVDKKNAAEFSISLKKKQKFLGNFHSSKGQKALSFDNSHNF
jgi:hypothetical protein